MYFLKTTTNFNGVFSIGLSEETRKNVEIKEMPLFTYKRSIEMSDNKINSFGNGRIVYVNNNTFGFMEYPLQIKTCSEGEIPDLFTRVDGYHLVSNDFKEFVESVDPGIHNFWEMDIYLDSRLVKGFYLMQVGRVLSVEGLVVTGSDKKRLKIYADELLTNKELLETVSAFPVFSLVGMEKGIVISNEIYPSLCDKDFYGFWQCESKQAMNYGDLLTKLL